MSVKISELTKVFGRQVAVDHLDFSLKKGEIVGFLGPNGAGKSTTMKMITGLLTPTSGEVSVCGYNIASDSLPARRLIGYLPENNPLYLDMYVREYLDMVAGIHRIQHARARIEEMIQQTGLEREAHKPIGALSKGYRQRVGLAQAMIHDPEVLILDEPTSGLDPNQLKDIRQLIRKLGAEKTVLFSTHIMQEVQAVCDRVILINKGRKVLDAPITDLDQRIKGSRQLEVIFKDRIVTDKLGAIPGVEEIIELGANHYQVRYDQKHDIRESIFELAVKSAWVILEMRSEKYSMEDIFQQMTKSA